LLIASVREWMSGSIKGAGSVVKKNKKAPYALRYCVAAFLAAVATVAYYRVTGNAAQVRDVPDKDTPQGLLFLDRVLTSIQDAAATDQAPNDVFQAAKIAFETKFAAASHKITVPLPPQRPWAPRVASVSQ
jgi:hypothetical protein